jgi:hypothetical protein
MITYFDPEYKLTKLVKRGKRHLGAPFLELARWIAATRKVNVLNIVRDAIPPDGRPRLQIILEHPGEMEKFREGPLGNYKRDEQRTVAARFKDLLADNGVKDFETDGLLVVFSSFAPLAKEEADSKITEKEIEGLKRRIGNPGLWKISRCFGSVTFFFYTDSQARKHERDGLAEAYASRYFELLKPHDEFDYIRLDEFRVRFDSKENFDKNYKGSWFNYYR